MAIIGIDLGTTNSLVSVWHGDEVVLIPNALGERLTPSVVSVGEEGEILTGKSAKERLVSHPDKTAAGFKQFMGTDKKYKLGQHSFAPEDLSALILRRLKEDAETYLHEPVTEAVISVPAYFNDAQRSATKLAGQLAGLTVERIINEPSAAALAYQHGEESDGLFLVFDFGGGTLDISVVEMFANIVDITAVSGDNHLGGSDIDSQIRAAFLRENPQLSEGLTPEENASLLKLAEQSKMALTETNATMMVFMRGDETFSMPLDNKTLSELCMPLLSRMRTVLQSALRDAGRPIYSVDEVILVGGSCRMPMVKEYIRYLTGKTPLEGIDPDLTVATGVGMVSGIKNRDAQIKDMILTDICPFTLGIETTSGDTGVSSFSPIIQRNTALPVSRCQSYTTLRDKQRVVEIHIYQGESLEVENNLLLDKLKISVPPLPKGEAVLEVRFTYDINGILEVDVECRQSGEKVSTLVVSNKNLSKAEIARRLKQLETLKISQREKEENRCLLARGERLYEEHTGGMREEIGRMMVYFQDTLDNHPSPLALSQARQRMTSFFDGIDSFESGLLGGTAFFEDEEDEF